MLQIAASTVFCRFGETGLLSLFASVIFFSAFLTKQLPQSGAYTMRVNQKRKVATSFTSSTIKIQILIIAALKPLSATGRGVRK